MRRMLRRHRERALGIGDVDLRQLFGEAVLHLGEAEHDPGREVAHRLRHRIAHDGDVREPGRIAQHDIADRAALARVAREQVGLGDAMNHQRQLPGEIEGVLHAGVHALAAGRAVDMGGSVSTPEVFQ